MLQGNLQNVFDALFALGVIDPVLKSDWKSQMLEMERDQSSLQRVVYVCNRCHSYQELLNELQNFDQKTLSFLAMEVAKEFAGFHGRDGQQLH